uniref:Uncharacterized protein n=1 Tax=Oryza brachyantha TaxID=4533 RepID=J3MH21_ORYBR
MHGPPSFLSPPWPQQGRSPGRRRRACRLHFPAEQSSRSGDVAAWLAAFWPRSEAALPPCDAHAAGDVQRRIPGCERAMPGESRQKVLAVNDIGVVLLHTNDLAVSGTKFVDAIVFGAEILDHGANNIGVELKGLWKLQVLVAHTAGSKLCLCNHVPTTFPSAKNMFMPRPELCIRLNMDLCVLRFAPVQQKISQGTGTGTSRY